MNPKRNYRILLVDDNKTYVELIRAAMQEGDLSLDIRITTSGLEALTLLQKEANIENARLPDLIVLDLRMLGMDGLEVLASIKADSRLRVIPVVILTSSSLEEDVQRSYELGANSYVGKPAQGEDFVEKMQSISRYWTAMNVPLRFGID